MEPLPTPLPIYLHCIKSHLKKSQLHEELAYIISGAQDRLSADPGLAFIVLFLYALGSMGGTLESGSLAHTLRQPLAIPCP
jgi:hypothetical protein